MKKHGDEILLIAPHFLTNSLSKILEGNFESDVKLLIVNISSYLQDYEIDDADAFDF